MLSDFLFAGFRPNKSDGELWTYASFAAEIESSRIDGNYVSERSVSNWCKGKSLPNEIEPILRALFGPSDRHVVQRRGLREAFQAARNERRKINFTKETASVGHQWKNNNNNNFVSINKLTENDIGNARNLLSIQLQGEISKLSYDLMKRSKRLSNTRVWSSLPKTASELYTELRGKSEEITPKLVKIYALALKLARFLETDVRVQRDPAQIDGPLDSDVHGSLNDVVRLIAPWLRNFPTIQRLDDEAGKALVRPELFQPAAEFTRIARKNNVITEKDAIEMEILAETASAYDFQGQKAGAFLVGGAKNLMLAGVSMVVDTLAQASKSQQEMQSILVQNVMETLLEAETQVLIIAKTLSRESQRAVKDVLEKNQVRNRNFYSQDKTLENNKAVETINELRDRFVQHISQELRSPLTNIIGFTELLGDETVGGLNARQREYAEHIRGSSSALLAIINDILDLASIDAHSLSLQHEPVDVRATIEMAARGLEDRLAESAITLDLDVPSDVGSFRADGKRVRQILFNLLSNAVGFSKAGQHVRVQARRTEREVVLSVIDQGRGIPSEVVARVFDRFESHTLGAERRGVGVGLSIARSLVELHGGRVEIQSELGIGTRVSCFFPLHAAL